MKASLAADARSNKDVTGFSQGGEDNAEVGLAQHPVRSVDRADPCEHGYKISLSDMVFRRIHRRSTSSCGSMRSS